MFSNFWPEIFRISSAHFLTERNPLCRLWRIDVSFSRAPVPSVEWRLHHSLLKNGKTGQCRIISSSFVVKFFVIFVVEFKAQHKRFIPTREPLDQVFLRLSNPFKDMAFVFMVLEIMHGLEVKDIFLQTSSTNLKMTLFSAALKKI